MTREQRNDNKNRVRGREYGETITEQRDTDSTERNADCDGAYGRKNQCKVLSLVIPKTPRRTEITRRHLKVEKIGEEQGRLFGQAGKILPFAVL